MKNNNSRVNKGRKVNQVGGSGSDFSGLWYSWEVSPAELSRVTLEKIDCSPMFNPLRKGTVIPTGTSGIIPAGVYLAALPPLVDTCATVECYNRGQVGLVTSASEIALQKVAEQQRLKDQQFVRQLSAQEGFPEQSGIVSDNSLINNLAEFMGMNPYGPSQTGSGKSEQKGGNSSTIKFFPQKSQDGGCCGNSFYTGTEADIISSKNLQAGGSCVPRAIIPAKVTSLSPNQQAQQGGTLSNGLGYSPFIGSRWTATSCANSCVPFNNTCAPNKNSDTSETLAAAVLPPNKRPLQGRQPVYYNETESREGCTSRCKMPAGRYSTSDLGCRATAFANKDIDYGTYDDLHGTNIAANAAPLPQACKPLRR